MPVREKSQVGMQGGVEPPPIAVDVRVPRQARRKASRKWDISNDGELGLNSKECMKESCSCPRADQTRGQPLSVQDPQRFVDFPDLQHQGRGPESSGIQRGILCPLGGLKRIPQQLNVATANGVTWEKMTPTVDSGASDTVILPHMLAWLETLHTEKVGT